MFLKIHKSENECNMKGRLKVASKPLHEKTSTCTTSKRYKFESKRTLDYFPKKYPEYANNWLILLGL